MAVLAIAAAGAGIGAAVGGTFLGVSAASWGWMAGSMVGNALLGGQDQTAEGPRLSDLRVTGTEYGQPIPYLCGAPRVAGQIIWASDRREIATTQTRRGGKGRRSTATTITYTYEVDLLFLISENIRTSLKRVWIDGDLVYENGVARAGVWNLIRFNQGDPTQGPEPAYEAAVGVGNAPAYRGRCTVMIEGLQLGTSGRVPNVTFETEDVDYSEFGDEIGTNVLSIALEFLMRRAGYDYADFNFGPEVRSEPRRVHGLALAQVASTRAALETLATAFFLHVTKGERITFRSRGSGTPHRIAFADLATSESDTATDEPLALTTASDIEVPSQIAVTYPNVLADYGAATEYSARLLGAQNNTQNVQLAVGMTPADAKTVADALLADQVTGMVTATITLPPSYSHIQPGDLVLVPDGHGRELRMFVQRRTDADLVITLELRQDDPTAWASAAVTDTGYTAGVLRQVAPTAWAVLDLPALTDEQDGPGYLVAMAPDRASTTDLWPGAVLSRAVVEEQFESVATTDEAATLGATTSALPAWSGLNTLDESTALLVRVTGELSSTTRAALQADRSLNALLVGHEIIRFRQADLLGTTSGERDYRITGLLRAQLGTEWAAASSKPAGTRAVLLNGALRRVADDASQIDQPVQVKAVTSGLLLSSATAEAFTNTGESMRPLAPVHLRALRDGAGGLAIAWQRRTRLAYRYGGAAGVAVPLGEEAEAYRITIAQGSSTLRTIDTTTAAATYSAAQQTADGLTAGDTIRISVAQRSARVGYGRAATLETTT